MLGRYIRHLPVMQGEDLVGIVSIGDVVRAIIGDKEFLIHELENYITGVPAHHQKEPVPKETPAREGRLIH